MPPKKKAGAKGGGAKGKASEKQKQRILEDKTFGLKNKKGKKQQQFVAQVKAQLDNKGRRGKTDEQKSKRQTAAEEKAMMNDLFKPVVQHQRVPKGEDPKSIVCAFYKKGQCTKGAKCKFSHDISLDNKSAKINVYVDKRDEKTEDADTMDQWDQAKLESVVKQKHGKEKIHPTTDIICKYFLDALEKGVYGWFWICPNGGDKCKYRHALPPGYILKKDRKKMEEQTEKISIEELIEQERAALGSDVTKITYESFLAWKKKKREERKKAAEESKKKKKKDFKDGKLSAITGREMFAMSLVDGGNDDDDEEGFDAMASRPKDELHYFDATVFENEWDKLAKTDDDDDKSPKTVKQESSESQETATNVDGVEVDADLFAGADLDDIDLDGLDLDA